MRNLGEVIQADRPLDKICMVDLRSDNVERTHTYRELERTTRRLSRGLARARCSQGAAVAIASENRFEAFAAYLAILRAGCVAVPINFKFPKETISYFFSDAKIQLAFADSQRIPLCPTGCPIVAIDGSGGIPFDEFGDHGDFTAVVPGVDQPAQILYTAGSTGVPKGVTLSHAGQCWALDHFLSDTPGPSEERFLVATPTFHMNGLFTALMAVANHATLVQLPRFDARRYIRAIVDYRCTFLVGVPSMFALLLRETDLTTSADFSSVTTLIMGSAPTSGPLISEVRELFPRARVLNGYGTTEAGPVVFGDHPDGTARPPLSVGYPRPDIHWRLSGDSEHEGVLELKTGAVMSGYLNRPAETALKFREGWLVTGDVMRRDADGFFFFVGRQDDMFVCGGENVFPGEVEATISRLVGVSQCCVVSVPDEIKGAVPAVFVVLRQGAVLSSDDVKRFALVNAPAYQHPRHVWFVDALPLSGVNKIDRQELKKRAILALS